MRNLKISQKSIINKGALLDTHILLWYLTDNPRLPQQLKEILDLDSKYLIYASIINLWEIVIKKSKNRLKLYISFEDLVKEIKFEILPLKIEHLKTLEKLEFLHTDPFDRLLISQALSENLTLITADREIIKYPISYIFIG